MDIARKTSSDLPSSAPVVIIGGGIVGVSTLYHLARRGVPAVLLERRKLASGTTWHAAGIVGQLRDSTAQTELGKYTARLFAELEIETGQATGYKPNGTINLALGEVRHEQLLRSHDHAVRMGIPTYLLTRDELSEKWPWIVVEDVRSAFFVPSNGQVNPLDVTVALSKGARAQGAQVFEQTKVTEIVIRDGKVAGVATDRGVIATGKVLLAGGMWSHLFAKAHGVTVPLHATEHFYIVTEPLAGLRKDQPILNIAEERTYWKEDTGKLLIGGFEAHGKPYGQSGIPEDFEFDQLPFDMDHVEPELERMFSRMPGLGDLGIQTFFNGPESFTPDGRPYLGPTSEVKGLFVATGMNSNGILNSGGVGLTMAEWLIDGQPSRGMGPLLQRRAHPFQRNTRYNRDRAAESVGFHYGVSWAGRQVHSARGVRRVPLHDRLAAAGATFAERIGWEMPQYYDPEKRGWDETPRLRWKAWSGLVQQECLAARDAAVLIDQSMYAKIQVQGPDAVRALNRVCGAEMDVAVGTSVYTQFLNMRGGIEADVTVTRIAPECFMVITGHPSQMRDQGWIRDHADPEWRFEIFDATSAYALLSLHGPQSRAILQALSDDDLSNAAFPFGAAREIDIAYARGWAIRRSFLGELGFELLLPAEFSAGIYDEILNVGQPLGLRHMGMFAMNACRIEKGFRHFGHDIAEDDTPYETGLGFAVALNKAEAFLGREALAQQKAGGPATRHRTVSVRVEGVDAVNGPYLIHNEPIWRDGRIVGHVTSGDWGFRLEAMVGLASLHRDEGVDKAWLDAGGFTVQIAGAFYPLTVGLAPFYDPQGARMRG
ncbi:4-methylaminobutanoate oxidase (formaldehyde-forming) [Gemmobacter caeni]|uniref:4-methylaminobutanoate oxidase (Formaldehyde-forming) n=1 Tax=Gemmobacter caeni TaxID=589035 RepID=A0A2T6B1Z6_9RHOB|nr:FAD-dependent oxidoreductase [Gemmobacter caeni]PTX50052.1 4-methylaminobutanoate oxidase (formaldehyde-forming) [Gemmobacter caeni]TWJ01947.1 4-methylaminobutanoate oxidase (formaldehyde-forming) [Gemmobacter caeni]